MSMPSRFPDTLAEFNSYTSTSATNEWSISSESVDSPHAGPSTDTRLHDSAMAPTKAPEFDFPDINFDKKDMGWVGEFLQNIAQLPTPPPETEHRRLGSDYDYDRGCFVGRSYPSPQYPHFALDPALAAISNSSSLQNSIINDVTLPLPGAHPVALPSPAASEDGTSPTFPTPPQLPSPALSEEYQLGSGFPLPQVQGSSEDLPQVEVPRPIDASLPLEESRSVDASRHIEQTPPVTLAPEIPPAVGSGSSNGGKVKKGKARRQTSPRDAKPARSHVGYPQPISLSGPANAMISCQIEDCTATISAGRASLTKHFLRHHLPRLQDQTEDARLKTAIPCPWPSGHGHPCGRGPMQVGNLGRHILDVHLALSKWKCPLCKLEMVARRDSAQRHIRDTCCAKIYASQGGKPSQSDLETYERLRIIEESTRAVTLQMSTASTSY